MADDPAPKAAPGLPGLSLPAARGRPLAGLTLLAVEDSRFTCEALRLLALASGARMRRADSLAAARRHLATYRPAVVLVDVGLPDGSGTDLIAALVAARPRVPVILATSADPSAERSARAAGADGFLPKPVERLADFQAAILTHLPDGAAAPPASVPEFLLPRRASVRAPVAARDEAAVAPDPLALRDDLRTAARVLADPASPDEIAWAARFVAGIALAARDPPLAAAARELARGAAAGPGRLQGMVEARLAAAQPL